MKITDNANYKKHSKGIELTSREVTIYRPIHTGGRMQIKEVEKKPNSYYVTIIISFCGHKIITVRKSALN